jgi:hypothetical protein
MGPRSHSSPNDVCARLRCTRKTLSKEADWPKLRGDTQDSHFKLDFNRLPGNYGVGLCKLAANMLRHNPRFRPDLPVLKKSIDDELGRLD